MQSISLFSRISQLFYSVECILCTVLPLPLSQWGGGRDEREEIIIDVFTSSTGEESYTMPVEDTVMKWVLN